MVTSKVFRQRGWAAIKNNYWKAFLATLIIGVVSFVISFADRLTTGENPAVTNPTAVMLIGIGILVLAIVVVGPLEVGLIKYFLNNRKGTAQISDVFGVFKDGSLGTVIKTYILVTVKVVLWSLLLIVPGIIKGFEYAMVFYLIAENPETSTKEAFAKSKALMSGNKWRLFKLAFSFIGWELLGALCFGVGTFFVMPYIYAAETEFYFQMKEELFVQHIAETDFDSITN